MSCNSEKKDGKSAKKRRNRTNLWLHPPKRCRLSPVDEPSLASAKTLDSSLASVTSLVDLNSTLKPHRDGLPMSPASATPMGATGIKPSSATLKRPPKKRTKRKRKSKRKLFPNSVGEDIKREMLEVLPVVLNKLQHAGLLMDFCKFLRLVQKGVFPLHNISMLLFFEVVRWYDLDNTSQMEYSPECLKFWKVFYRMFHGKALRFMAGVKSTGQILTDETKRGEYKPELTAINFAVPSQSTVANFRSVGIDIPDEIPPGVINQALDMVPKQKSYVLSFDGKKLAPGLNKTGGDQDLFGNEDGETLQIVKQKLETEVNLVESVIREWQSMSDAEKIDKLTRAVLILSNRIKDLRVLYMKQRLALKRFHKEAGEDWRTSKYVYAISSVQALMFQIQSVVKRCLDTNELMLKIGATINKADVCFSSASEIDTYSQKNCVTLKEPTGLPEEFSDDARFIKQRSPEWFALREQFRLTGSKLYEAMGLDTLKKQQTHFDKVVKGLNKEEEIPDEVKKRMEHGTVSEIHAVATLTTKVLPFYYPSASYVEEGAHIISNGESPFILVSPDGSLRSTSMLSPDIQNPVCGCEFKCPVGNEYTTPVHYEIPLRYIPQVLGEMASMGVQELLYLCWSEESSTLFRYMNNDLDNAKMVQKLARFDEDLWQMIWDEAVVTYSTDNPKRPSRLSENSKIIKERLVSYQKCFTEFICEIPSSKGTRQNISQTHSRTPYIFPVYTVTEKYTVDHVEDVLQNVISCIQETHLICRKKATEVLVWMLSDTDRRFHTEIPYSVPVAYAMKGYSLGTQTMRKMHEEVLKACYEKGINVICTCFDGQWVKLATRDKQDRAITMIQLQRDVYTKACKAKRDVIVNELQKVQVVQNIDSELIIDRSGYMLSISCPTLRRMFLSAKHCVKQKVAACEATKDKSVPITDAVSSLPDEALETLLNDDNIAGELTAADTNDRTGPLMPGRAEHVSAELQADNETEDPRDNQINAKKQPEILIDQDDLLKILHGLQCHEKQTIKGRWAEKSLTDLKPCISDIELLQKLHHDELNVIIDSTKSYQRRFGITVSKSLKLVEKINMLSKLLGLEGEVKAEATGCKMLPLKVLCSKIVRSNTKVIPKDKLNNVYAARNFEVLRDIWLRSSPFADEMDIEGFGATAMFSYPEINEERKILEPKCLDSHHLLVNLRSKVCKDGLQGINKDAWHQVAESNGDIISKALVVDLIDKQNNAFAQRTFSHGVEQEMRRLNFNSEADFCHIIRSWYEAEDSPGLSSLERTRRRVHLKHYLLKDIDFGVFPPPGMYIKGFPKGMYEGFLQRIDTCIQLYSVIQSFNQRSVSSLVNETFFGELSEIEPTKLGCPKAIHIPRLMSTVTELLHYRCDPSERSFKISTKRRSAYQNLQLLRSTSNEEPSTALSTTFGAESKITSVSLRDHDFDDPSRAEKKQRISKASDVSNLHAVTRGCMPIRALGYKLNESKVLPTTRLRLTTSDSKKEFL